MTYEHCTECDAETGRAGKHDDSLYHASEGPYCVECYESWAENIICERDQLRTDNQRLREALGSALALFPFNANMQKFTFDGVVASADGDELFFSVKSVIAFLEEVHAALTTANKEPCND
jgi:hypothetical protein